MNHWNQLPILARNERGQGWGRGNRMKANIQAHPKSSAPLLSLADAISLLALIS